MKRQRQTSSIENILSIDSLIDIVSNMVGILVIIGVISSLNLGGKNYIYQTPLVKSTEKRGVYFECAGDRLIPVTHDSGRYYTRIFAAFEQVLIPKSKEVGELRWELGNEQSYFRKILADLNPNEQFIALFVRPNGFDTFRMVRKIAWENGFNVGWFPKPQHERIIFSPYGSSSSTIVE